LEPAKLTVHVEADETDGAAAQEVYDVLATHLPAGMTVVNVATEDELSGPSARTANAATGTITAQRGDEPAARTAPPVNLAARFTLDDAAARGYVESVIAAYDEDESPGDDDTPRFGADWEPRGYYEETTVTRLVRYAADHGLIGRPAGMDVDFVYVAGASDGGSYHFAVDVGHDFVSQVTLTSWPSEMRKLVDDETGADAAMSILGEAVTRANRVLDRLAELIADQAAAIAAAAA